ncbi:MAG: R3H domain-containing nucleic acid-binding protein [Acidobacteriota bacterium]
MTDKMLFSGGTLQQAILAAARHFHLDADDVAYQVRDRRQGVVRGRQRIVVEVDPKTPGRVASAPPSPPVEPSVPSIAAPAPAPKLPKPLDSESVPPSTAEPRRALAANGPEAEAVQASLDHLTRLADLQLEATIVPGPSGLVVDLGGRNAAELIAEDARLLQAIEHLLPRVARGLYGEAIAVAVDSGGLQERLYEELRVLARAAVARVRSTGSPEVLPEMNPAARRIVHMTVAEDPGMATESLGGGVFKRIQIRLV